MSPRKTKHPALEESDTRTQNRRSSLRVNLSYTSSVSDSGNESYSSLRTENNASLKESSGIVRHRDIASPKMLHTSNCKVSRVRSISSAMKEKDMLLDKSCRSLKELIMNKTQEIFDGNEELTKKTASIFQKPKQALKEINANSKKSLPNVSKRDRSIVLGASNQFRNKILSKKKDKVLMVKLTRIEHSQLSQLETSMESNMSDIGAPITCSSFISSHELSPRRTQQETSVITDNMQEPTRKTTEPVSNTDMEITAIRARLSSTTSKNSMNLPEGSVVSKMRKINELNNVSSNEKMSMELTNLRSRIIICQSTNNSKTSNSSLDVNTSRCLSTRSIEGKNSAEDSTQSQDNNIQKKQNTINLLSEESNSFQKVNQPATSKNNNKDASSDKSEKSMGKNAQKTDNIISDGDADLVKNDLLLVKLRSIADERRSKVEGPSFVQGTPFPPSRSILWRSQIRSETFGPNKNKILTNYNDGNTLKKHSLISDASSSTSNNEYMTVQNTVTVLNESPCRISREIKNLQIIEESFEEEENLSERTSKNVKALDKNTTGRDVKKIRKKKKLLPLSDRFEIVSLSPLKTPTPSPKNPVKIWKSKKKICKRNNIRAAAEKRIDISHRANSSDDDDSSDGKFSFSNIKKIQTQNEKLKVRKPRKVISKKIIVKKIVDKDLYECLLEKNSRQSNCSERGSTNEFLTKKRLSVSGRNSTFQKIVLVATGFSKGDVDLVKSVVKELGGAEINSMVTRHTTHVVSTGVRTINLLRGIIRGCWLVSLDWVLNSLENEKWLDAEKYEMAHFSKAVKENRRDRQFFGKAYVPELFTACGLIHVENKTTPPSNILKELIKTAGGQITENYKRARVSVGPNGVREIWILDCITTGDVQPIDEYRKK